MRRCRGLPEISAEPHPGEGKKRGNDDLILILSD